MLICLALCGLILLFAGADRAHTQSRLPNLSDCPRGESSCLDARRSERLERDRKAEPLQSQYDTRAWLYAFAILAIAAVTAAYKLRSSPRQRWPAVFTNLGVIGVWLGIGAVLVLVSTDGNAVTVPPAPVLMLPVALIVTAVAGTLMARSEGWAEQSQVDGVRDRVVHLGKLAIHIGTAGQARRSRIEQLAGWLSLAAVALTALTCLFALAFVLAQPSCEGIASPPAWSVPIDAVAAVSAIGAMAAGIGALLLRRWVPALISLAVCPVALLEVLISTCVFS